MTPIVDRASGQAEQKAVELMTRFAERTGLTSSRPPRRYLWTDSFAVCTFLGFAATEGASRTSTNGYFELARRLVHQVHHVLGRHRDDDGRVGWISGLSEADGEEHPTRGGLRIGKPLPERGPGESFDPQQEWDRDGQYFHYLTKWMHALDQLARITRAPHANRWARELAASAHAAFTVASSAGVPRRMVWKASIDLRRVLVPSMGHHDPLDGLVTALQLREGSAGASGGPDLAKELADLKAMVRGRDWWTDDPLGIGGLLTDAYRLDQITRRAPTDLGHLLPEMLVAAASGTEAWLRQRPLDRSAGARLGFRELGLSIGLRAARRMHAAWKRDPGPHAATPEVGASLERLVAHFPVSPTIESFWLEHLGSESWLAHRDIDEVMLATSLAPNGYLELR